MANEDNKALVYAFFATLDRGDIDGAMAMLAEDATWWTAGKPGTLPVTGERSRARMARVLHGMVAELKAGLAMKVKGIVAEGDKLAVEVESLGELRNGRVYNNQYHFLITVRGGAIASVKEYYDTHHVHAIWVVPGPAAGGT